jgi:hypothetical protein
MSEFIPGILLVVGCLAVITIVVVYCLKLNDKVNEEIRQQLKKQGYVVDFPVAASGHAQLTRIWQLLDEPSPLYLHISSLDPLASAAGMLGVADLRIGEGSFDAEFIVRSNNPVVAKRVLTQELQKELLSFSRIGFRTGSLNGLLSVDYLPEVKADRELRKVWAIEARGRLTTEEIQRLLNLGLQMRDAVIRSSQEWEGPKEFKVKFMEGR